MTNYKELKQLGFNPYHNTLGKLQLVLSSKLYDRFFDLIEEETQISNIELITEDQLDSVWFNLW